LDPNSEIVMAPLIWDGNRDFLPELPDKTRLPVLRGNRWGENWRMVFGDILKKNNPWDTHYAFQIRKDPKSPHANLLVVWRFLPPARELTGAPPAAGVEEQWVVIGSSVAAWFSGLEEIATREGSHLLVERGRDDVIVDLISRGHSADARVHYYGGLEEAKRFQIRAAGALISATLHVPTQPDFMSGMEEILLAAGLTWEIVSTGLEEMAAGLEQLDVAA